METAHEIRRRKKRPAKTAAPAAATSGGSLREATRALFENDVAKVSETELNRILARVSDAVPAGLVLCGRRGEISYVNEYLMRLLDASREDLVGRPAAAYFGNLRERLAVLRAGRDMQASTYESQITTRSGRRVAVQIAAQRIDDAHGNSVGGCAIITDISARTLAAASLRRSESELRLLSAQLIATQELERQRIAAELHDGIGQSLSEMKFALEDFENLLSASGVAAGHRNTVRQLVERIRREVDEVRRIAMGLRPSTLDDLGILATLGWYTREFRASHRHVELETVVDMDEDQVAVPAKTAIFRIVQEATNNIVTHSGARKALVSLTNTMSHIELVIRDDGAGFEPTRFAAIEASGRGFGLASMRERAELSGGRFQLKSAQGRGTTVRVTWPRQCGRAAWPDDSVTEGARLRP
jgi:PAS domain S-box-containing protein